jgi:2-amino-4-hydroxy-6-hydroxymethyldihydropteridine diphosphokinase
MGRTDGPEYDADGQRIYHNRIIDIDILFFGDLQLESPRLTLPHPQVFSRPFVGELLAMLQ